MFGKKKPQVENLVVQGVSVLLSEMLENEHRGGSYEFSVKKAFSNQPFRGLVNWKEKSPAKMLGMTREEFRRCAKGKWDTDTLQFWQSEKENGRVLTDAEIKLAKSIGYHECRWMVARDLDWMKGARYIARQKAKDKRADMNIFKDYWRIAEQVGEDMTLTAVRFPPHLMRAHDRVEDVRQWQEEAKKKEEREARAHLFTELYTALEPLSWEYDGIFIRPVKDELELSAEGKQLHHCVGSYAQTHIKGDQPIFVIRKADEPNTPWYTLQLNVKKLDVVQNRGLRNCDRTKEITEFELRWLAHIRELAQAKKKKPRQRATKSKTQPLAPARQRERVAV
ncbi:PcfJ domain-containing protein [Oscillospiraceae bacterium OttesenSCG-928-F05]|nr:PcfJ domain-containing protein [Oscillospiraceae bacterium OttesenSCG-928-F05]